MEQNMDVKRGMLSNVRSLCLQVCCHANVVRIHDM